MISSTASIQAKIQFIRKNIDYRGLYTPISRIYTHKYTIYGDHLELKKYKNIRLSYKNPARSFVRKSLPRTSRSVYRSRENLVRLVESARYQFRENTPIFATLTYARNEQNIKESYSDFSYFIKKIRRYTGVKVEYVAVPEFQSRGAIHFHIIFFNLPYIPVKKFEKLWGHGYTNIQVAKKPLAVSKYLLKYFTKSNLLDPRFIGIRVCLTSRGLIRPKTYFDEHSLETIQNYCTLNIVDVTKYDTFSIYKIRILMTQELLFVGHSKGVYEGINFDYFMLSNGVRAFKVKNATGVSEFPNLIPEKTKVLVTFSITAGKKEQALVQVAKIEPTK